ncbi:MAG: hypothetical protein HOP08_16005 [Cyclobacteriaceae bacterium]|nr:hypothetical protein [Cyclobacteriaceae bacterium]
MKNEDEFKVKAYTMQQLADCYHTSMWTLRRWLKPIQSDIGKRVGHFYTPKQVQKIIDHLGAPFLAIAAFFGSITSAFGRRSDASSTYTAENMEIDDHEDLVDTDLSDSSWPGLATYLSSGLLMYIAFGIFRRRRQVSMMTNNKTTGIAALSMDEVSEARIYRRAIFIIQVCIASALACGWAVYAGYHLGRLILSY